MDINAILKETGALLEGHFLLSSGLHSDSYIQCAKVLQYPWHANRLGKEIADRMTGYTVDCVISPAMGGIIIGYEVAKHLNVPFIFAERDEDGTMKFRRGFDPSSFKHLAVVEDVITTGKSTKEIIDLARTYECKITFAGAIANRGNLKQIDDLVIKTIIDLPLKTYDPLDCPMCMAGMEIVKPGTRKFIR